MKRRGFSLLTVMFLLVLAGSAVLGMALMVNSQRLSAQKLEFQDKAHRYAANAVELALARLEKDSNSTETVRFDAQPGDREDAVGLVTYDSGELFHSVNNFGKYETAVFTAGDFHRIIPRNSIYLLGKGQYGNAVVYEEAIASMPPYEFALASAGSMATEGAFLVGALEDPAALAEGVDSPAFLQALRRASLASNSAASPAIRLEGAPVKITGNVVSPGTVVRGPGVQVDGIVEEGHRPVGLPVIPLQELDPAGRPLLLTLENEVVSSTLDIDGFARRAGNLRISGDLKLSEGVLFVDGDLTVTGAISGLGCVVCTGRCTVSSASLRSLKQVALLSRGDLTITGSGAGSTLVGLVYSEGNLSLSDVTVVGCVVCAREQGGMTLRNVNVLRNAAGVAFEMEMGFQGGTQSGVITMQGRGAGGQQVRLRLKQVADASAPGGMREARPSDFAPPNAFDAEQALEVVDATTGEPVAGVSVAQVFRNPDTNASSFRSNILDQILRTEAQSIYANGKVDLDLNRFLKLSDKLKVVYRRTHYGIPATDPTS